MFAVWAVLVLVLWQLLPSCCCCCCCWNSSEQFRELRHGEPERRQLAALRTKPVPRQEVTPATFSRTLDLFSATWELARSSAKKIGSWCQSQEKDLTVQGSFHQQVHLNKTDAFIVVQCSYIKHLFLLKV